MRSDTRERGNLFEQGAFLRRVLCDVEVEGDVQVFGSIDEVVFEVLLDPVIVFCRIC